MSTSEGSNTSHAASGREDASRVLIFDTTLRMASSRRGLAEQAGKARDRPAAGAPWRGHHRGGLPDHLARRRRGGAGDRPGGRRPGHLRAGAAAKQDIDAAWAAVKDAERPASIRSWRRATCISGTSCRPPARTSGAGPRGGGARARIHRRCRVLAGGRLASDPGTWPRSSDRLDAGARTINVPDAVGNAMRQQYASGCSESSTGGCRGCAR